MLKEDTSVYITMLKDVKNEILKQLQNSEASIKQQFRSSLEEKNSKLSNLTNSVRENTNSVRENSTKISN